MLKNRCKKMKDEIKKLNFEILTKEKKIKQLR